MSQVVTGEAVPLDLRAAALPTRMTAALLDLGIQLLIGLVLAIPIGVTGAVSSDAAAAALGVVLLVVVLIGYPVTFETLTRGRTPGKAALGLRVVRDDGGPIGFRHALVRGLAGAVLEKPGLTFGVLAVLLSLFHPSHKRMGDLLAGTLVLRERVAVRGGALAQVPPGLEGWARSLDLAGLGDGLALSARQFLARADALTDAARAELGQRLTDAVLGAVTPPPPPGTSGWDVLQAVVGERRRREAERLHAAAHAASRPVGGRESGGGRSGATQADYLASPSSPQAAAAAPAPAPAADQAPPTDPTPGFAPPL